MADQKKPGPQNKNSSTAKPELREDDLVGKLLPDPSTHPALTAVSGFLGRGSQPHVWRLYLTPSMDRYVEISEDDIVHSQAIGPDQSALGGTVVWVRSEASLTYTRTTSRQVQAEFLKGSILGSFTPRATGLPAAIMSRLKNAARFNSINICASDACSVDVCSIYWFGHCGGGGGGGGDTDMGCGVYVTVDIC